ncbi:hypothetical protein [Levilactobacillus fujinensis]|uniref:Uncharacterized protein n=1 Tax=Levilactobacillus fujinensis TaxID=2486024 RepID=A0ABW1TGD7_9LACO|nr:hypothetical protein [Levilactobacillus fujinensis]
MLDVQNVNTYISHKKIVADATFSLQPGSITGLIGPNGAGGGFCPRVLLGGPLAFGASATHC